MMGKEMKYLVSNRTAETQCTRGFTLLEVLVAMSIMVIVAAVVLSISSGVLNTWTRSSEKIGTDLEAQLILDTLVSDFESMIDPGKQINYMQVQPNLSPPPFVTHTSDVYMLSRVFDRPLETNSGRAIVGDICALNYQLVYKSPFSADDSFAPEYSLYRAVVDAENTMNGPLSLKPMDSADESSQLSSYWQGNATRSNDEALSPAAVSETGRQITGQDAFDEWVLSAGNLIASNVVEFQLLFWYLPKGSLEAIPLTSDDTSSGELDAVWFSDKLYRLHNSELSSLDGRLSHVDISLVLLSASGANQLTRDTDQQAFEQIKNVYGHYYSRRVVLLSTGL